MDFKVVLKNVNYHNHQSVEEKTQDKSEKTQEKPEKTQDKSEKTQDKQEEITDEMILTFCTIPRTKAEIAKHCGYKSSKRFTNKYLRPLLASGTLRMTDPTKPTSRNQKYVSVVTKDK